MDNLTKATHILLQFQMTLKIYHWQTEAYARHVASDSLHSSISSHIDKIVETLQGELQKRIKFTPTCSIKLINQTDKTIVDTMVKFRTWLETDFLRLFSHSKFLSNIRDEIVTDLNKALYLFTLN